MLHQKTIDIFNHEVRITRFRTAGIAQLVERNLAKVEVASSRLVFRSLLACLACKEHKEQLKIQDGGIAKWLCSGLQSRLDRFDSDSCLFFLPGWWN